MPPQRPRLAVVRSRMRISLAATLAAVPLAFAGPAAGDPLPAFGDQAVHGMSSSDGSSISDIRVGSNVGFDRFVIDFEGPIGSWYVSYVDGVTTTGSGAPVAVEGSAFIQVSVHIGTNEPPLQETINTGLSGLIQVVDVYEPGPTDLIAAAYGLGTAQANGFRAFTLTDPPRLVVDIAHPGATPTATNTADPTASDASDAVPSEMTTSDATPVAASDVTGIPIVWLILGLIVAIGLICLGWRLRGPGVEVTTTVRRR